MNVPSESSTSRNGNGDSLTHEHHTPPAHLHRVTPPPQNSMGWKLSILVVLLAVALCVGFFIVHHHRASETFALISQTKQIAAEPATVDTAYATLASTSHPLSLPGETHGWYQSVIYARVNGYVEKWNVDIGDKVKKGQVLATIQTPDLDAQLRAAQEQFAVAQSEITVAQANADFADTTFKRWKESPKGVVAEQETEEKKAAYDSSMAALKAAQAKASAAQAQVGQLQAMESYKQVTAPFDGVITSRRIDIGDLVTAGSTSNTSPLFDIAQADTIRVFTDVPQEDSGQIKIGMPAHTTSNNFPGKVFDGKVTRTDRSIDPQTRMLKVEVDIPNPDLTLMPGMYVQVRFDVSQNALVEVPASAVIFKTAGPEVAIVDRDGKIQFHKVDIAVDDGNVVDVGSGVAAGDQVALNISTQITNGQQVQPIDVEGEKPAATTAAPTTAPAAQPVHTETAANVH